MASPLGMILLVIVLLAASSCAGRDFVVDGGRDRWTANPADPQTQLLINDTLDFKRDKDMEAVLLVSQSHYDACNSTEPFHRLDDDDSRVVLISPGTYFFISADAGRCRAGERLNVVVLDVCGNAPSPLLLAPAPSFLPQSKCLCYH